MRRAYLDFLHCSDRCFRTRFTVVGLTSKVHSQKWIPVVSIMSLQLLMALKLVSAGDGLISLDEFSQLINGLGLEHATPGTVVALFNKYNRNSTALFGTFASFVFCIFHCHDHQKCRAPKTIRPCRHPIR